jgi:hypothetical protein
MDPFRALPTPPQLKVKVWYIPYEMEDNKELKE